MKNKFIMLAAITATVLFISFGCVKKDNLTSPAAAATPTPALGTYSVPTAVPTDMSPSKIYGTAETESQARILNTSDGGYVVMSVIYGGSDGTFLAKTGSDGSLQWQRTYPDNLYEIIQTSDNGYILAGDGPVIFKVDSLGNSQWSVVHDPYTLGIEFDRTAGIADTSDGLVLADDKFNLIKVDYSGNPLWTYEENPGMGSISMSGVEKLIKTGDGGFLMAGDLGGVNGYIDMHATKINSSGGLVFSRDYGTVAADFGTSCVESGGNYTILGYTLSTGAYSYIYQVINASGNHIQQITSRGVYANEFDAASDIIPSGDGNFIVTGIAAYYTGSDYIINLKVSKITMDFLTLWEKYYYLGNLSSYMNSRILRTGDGGYILGGTRNNAAGTDWQVFLMKLDSNGDKIW